MIQLRLSSAVLARTRFAYSPLAEAAKSLYAVHSGTIHPLHRGWYDEVRDDLRRVDDDLLRAVVPPGGHVPEFLFVGATGIETTIEDQLHLVASWPVEHFRAELERAWRGVGVTATARRMLEEPDAPQRVAAGLERYWHQVLAPYWPRLRGVLDADVAYRLDRLARGGIGALLADLHPSLQVTDDAIQIRSVTDGSIDGEGGLTLVPCVFVWPRLWVELGLLGQPSLTYGARGVGTLWAQQPVEPQREDVLGELLGSTRAEILVSLGIPRSTTDLAHELCLTPPTVSSHLSILRRSGLVTSWRSGRRVLYQRTALASMMVSAGREDDDTAVSGS
jgi:DNA-binding transcriptional ArsR family regulator